MKFCVYAHRRADTDEVFYIGKGVTKTRPFTIAGRGEWWTRVYTKAGGRRVEIFSEFEKEADALEYERCAIACYKAAGFSLCNLTDGGEGCAGYVQTPEHVAARSHKGRSRSPESKARMSYKQREIAASRPPGYFSEMAKLLRGCKQPAELVEKRAASNRGKKRSPEQRKNISDGCLKGAGL